MEEGYEPKISLVEILLVLIIIVPAEIASMVFPYVGGIIVDIIVGPLLTFYLWIKGLSIIRQVVMVFLEFTPINFLPLLTAGFLLTVWLDRNPKLAEVATQAAAIKGKGAAGAKKTAPHPGEPKGKTGAAPGAPQKGGVSPAGAQPAESRAAGAREFEAKREGGQREWPPEKGEAPGVQTAEKKEEEDLATKEIEVYGVPEEAFRPMEKVKKRLLPEQLEALEARNNERENVIIDDKKNTVNLKQGKK